MTAKRPSTSYTAAAQRHQPQWVLEPRAIRMLDRLPPEMRLLELRRTFPHVINIIAQHWGDAAGMQKTMQSLLIDNRGGRQGFPADVRRELAELADYYFAAISNSGSPAS